MRFVNLNGKFFPADTITITASNSAFRYGYGLFETLFVREGMIQLETYHWQRLWEGMDKMFFEIPKHFTKEILGEEVLKCVKKNGCERIARVRLQVFTEWEGLFSQERKLPQYLIECFEIDESITGWNENGLECGIAEGIVKAIDEFSNLKTCNMQPYIIAAQQAKARRWNDALIVNQHNHIIESSIANIFWVKDRITYTPPLSEGCIAGVMRSHLIQEFTVNKIAFKEKSLSQEDLFASDEVFVTNAIRGIKWIKKIERTHYRLPDISRYFHNTIIGKHNKKK